MDGDRDARTAADAPVRIPGRVPDDKYTTETITSIRAWTPHLFSFRTTRAPGFRFTAGQFARLGVYRDDTPPWAGDDPERRGPRFVWRAYSMVSASHDDFLEFYSIVVPDGDFTTKLAELKVGDTLMIEKAANGFLTLDRFEQGRDLWMLASGTGIAPFVSLLHELDAWQQYERLVLVHSVRTVDELAYRDTIAALRTHEVFGEFLKDDPSRLVYVPLVTREAASHDDGRPMLNERITCALADGSLEREAGVKLDVDRSRIMLCGNPQMVEDLRTQLIAAGYAMSRRAKPAHIAVENYW